MDTKVCTKCGIEKPATSEFFHQSKRGKYGVMTLCKECRNKSRRKEGGIIDIEERFKRGMKVCPRRDCVLIVKNNLLIIFINANTINTAGQQNVKVVVANTI